MVREQRRDMFVAVKLHGIGHAQHDWEFPGSATETLSSVDSDLLSWHRPVWWSSYHQHVNQRIFSSAQ